MYKVPHKLYHVNIKHKNKRHTLILKGVPFIITIVVVIVIHIYLHTGLIIVSFI